MMIKNFRSLLWITGIISVTSCEKQHELKDCISYTTATVTRVEGQKVISSNQATELSVFYFLNNGCGRFDKIEATPDGNNTTISLKAVYSGCVCTEALVSGEAKYSFYAPAPGTYYLKFVQQNKSYFLDTITVN